MGVALLAGCAPSGAKLEAMARLGEIQADAPIKADASILIAAPPQTVWRRLTDIDHWPDWQLDIHSAKLVGPLASGSTFVWRSSVTVRSRLALVRPPSTMSWTGHALGLKAVHVWTISDQRDGRTQLRTRESMDGWPMSLLYNSAQLQASDLAWLAALKKASEAAPDR